MIITWILLIIIGLFMLALFGGGLVFGAFRPQWEEWKRRKARGSSKSRGELMRDAHMAKKRKERLGQ